jgi:hypothetical protein
MRRMMFIMVYSMPLSALLIANGEIVLEANVEKKEYMFMFRRKNVGHIHYIKIGHKSFEIVTKLTYVGTTLKNQTFMHVDIKAR